MAVEHGTAFRGTPDAPYKQRKALMAMPRACAKEPGKDPGATFYRFRDLGCRLYPWGHKEELACC